MDALISFFTNHWETGIVIILLVQNFIKGLRDALDTTPETDDNVFEKFATISTKLLGYLIGFRAKK